MDRRTRTASIGIPGAILVGRKQSSNLASLAKTAVTSTILANASTARLQAWDLELVWGVKKEFDLCHYILYLHCTCPSSTK